ncbi:MAG TPA: dienelactone hydrolase family protein [bacterium]|nr:dienelactone hydrolase family protein [bacterium]
MSDRIVIETEDGNCPAWEFHRAGKGPWPGVLLYMDGIGIRPAMFEIAERLAGAGYFVLLPDLYYRVGPYEPMDAKTVFRDPEKRAMLLSKFMPAASVANVMKDTRAFLAHLAAHPSVKQPKIGTTGYCMGGRLSLCAAGHFPDRIAAAASYHGGNLANDAPDSPHLLAPKMKARVYAACAIEDANFPDEQKARLEKALTDAKVDHVVETYPARHGWVPTDTPVHDAAAAERHWKTLIDLFDRTLRS